MRKETIERVFADAKSVTLTADPEEIEGFSTFLERYRKAMPLEMLAPEVL